MLTALFILMLCIYVIAESISVASASNGIHHYFENISKRGMVRWYDPWHVKIYKIGRQFAMECMPFCTVLRYVFNIIAAFLIAIKPFGYIKAYILIHAFNLSATYPVITVDLIILAIALTLNCWGRMVYRVVGERRMAR